MTEEKTHSLIAESLSTKDRDVIQQSFNETYLTVETLIIEKDKAWTFVGLGKMLSYLELLGEDPKNSERFKTAVRLANHAFGIDLLATPWQKDIQE